jgi:hypothetical protein
LAIPKNYGRLSKVTTATARRIVVIRDYLKENPSGLLLIIKHATREPLSESKIAARKGGFFLFKPRALKYSRISK